VTTEDVTAITPDGNFQKERRKAIFRQLNRGESMKASRVSGYRINLLRFGKRFLTAARAPADSLSENGRGVAGIKGI
jgi:hypothetical protein